MANRRMFSKLIVRSDAFLDMPSSTQNLYFQLNMEADDDGFVGNPKTIVRIASASEDDLKLLIAKKFLIAFESGIVVVKHFKINNYIQKDRYHESNYMDEKSRLYIRSNNAYTLDTSHADAVPVIPLKPSDSNMYPKCIHVVSKMDTESSLVKSSLGKSSPVKSSIEDRLTEDETRRLRGRYGNYDDLIKKVDGMIAVNNTEVRKPYSYISKIAENENWPSVIEANAKKANREAALKAREEADRRLVEEAQKKAEELKHDQKI